MQVEIKNVRAPILIPEDVDSGALVNLDISGNANTATQLENPPDITFTGDVTGTFCLTGASDLTVPLTVSADVGGHGLPTGGSTGQVLKKNSATDYDTIWGTTQSLPIGGTSGQVLKKNTSTDYDVTWGTSQGIPTGGTSGQILTKSSGTDYDATWSTVQQGSASKYEPSGSSSGACIVTATGTGVTFSKSGNTCYLTPPTGVKILSARIRFTATEIGSDAKCVIDWDTTQSASDYANSVVPNHVIYNDVDGNRALKSAAVNLNTNAHTMEITSLTSNIGVVVKLAY